MKVFPFFKKKYFSAEDKNLITEAIRRAESQTSVEVRVYIEGSCRYVDALDRAAELFQHLHMNKTALQNAVLVYVALRDHQYAIYADSGVHQQLGRTFWEEQVRHFQHYFQKAPPAQALQQVIHDLGNVLKQVFPHLPGDRNELPDDLLFGKD
ncbi:MAG: TPM domain-containing protein [Chitinophagaceae bacterium]